MIETVPFDLETTGVDVKTDLIVTAFVGQLDENGTLIREMNWTVNPGIPVPEGAAAVHGWTTERLETTPGVRQDLDAVVMEIAALIWALCGNPTGPRLPLSGHNLAYDLTLLKHSLERQGVKMFPLGPAGVRVLDSIVLDKHYNKFVRGTGQRKLIPTAARYGIRLSEEDAHNASFDALAAGRICQAIIAKHRPDAAVMLDETINTLHTAQIAWRAADQASLQTWLRTKGGEPDAICEPGWPVH